MRRHKCYNIEDIHEGKRTTKRIVKGGLFGILGVGIAILLGFVTMWLWNKLMVDIFSLRAITYWEAVGLFILAKIFFGGFGGGGDHNDKPRHHVKKEISKEFDKEFDKEFENELRKNYCKDEKNPENDNYDELYEKWWNEKGEKSFSEYMNDEGNE